MGDLFECFGHWKSYFQAKLGAVFGITENDFPFKEKLWVWNIFLFRGHSMGVFVAAS